MNHVPIPPQIDFLTPQDQRSVRRLEQAGETLEVALDAFLRAAADLTHLEGVAASGEYFCRMRARLLGNSRHICFEQLQAIRDLVRQEQKGASNANTGPG